MVDYVDVAAQLNLEIKALQKELDGYKAQLKSSGIGEYTGTNYRAEVTERVTDKLNTERATKVAERYGLDWLLKSVIDETKLEADLAQGTFNDEIVAEFAKCVNTNTTLALKFKRICQNSPTSK